MINPQQEPAGVVALNPAVQNISLMLFDFLRVAYSWYPKMRLFECYVYSSIMCLSFDIRVGEIVRTPIALQLLHKALPEYGTSKINRATRRLAEKGLLKIAQSENDTRLSVYSLSDDAMKFILGDLSQWSRKWANRLKVREGTYPCEMGLPTGPVSIHKSMVPMVVAGKFLQHIDNEVRDTSASVSVPLCVMAFEALTTLKPHRTTPEAIHKLLPEVPMKKIYREMARRVKYGRVATTREGRRIYYSRSSIGQQCRAVSAAWMHCMSKAVGLGKFEID